MLHPDTETRWISPTIGRGVFATRHIPKGTLTYVTDPLEVRLTPRAFDRLPPESRAAAEKYSYIDTRGIRIISWDDAKYVNHRCDCNTITTAYGFELALRDIQPGEEITDEYALFSEPDGMPLACGCVNCRGEIREDDILTYHAIWDGWILGALAELPKVRQPLWELVDARTRRQLDRFYAGRAKYRSVLELHADLQPHDCHSHPA